MSHPPFNKSTSGPERNGPFFIPNLSRAKTIAAWAPKPSAAGTSDPLEEEPDDFGSWFGLGAVDPVIWEGMARCAISIPLANVADIDAQTFDVTVEGSARLCQVFDESSDGAISRDELLQGLESKGFSGLATCPSFYALIEKLEQLNEMTTVTPEQLAWILQRTKLQTLTNDMSVFDIRCTNQFCIDPEAGRLCTRQYNAKDSVCITLNNNEDIRKFFCCDDRRKHIARTTVQWISLDNVGRDASHMNVCPATEQNRRYLLMLAVRFRLHPLTLEKLLNLHSERPKRYVFGRHDFMVIPVWRLSARSEQSFCRYLRGEITDIVSDQRRAEILKLIRPFIEIEECQIAIFNDVLTWNELIQVQSKWYLAGMRIHSAIPFQFPTPDSDRVAPDDPETLLFRDLYSQLNTNYSMLRRGNTEWLQFAILDTISKNLVRVTESLRQLIDFHQDLLHAQEAAYSKKDIYFLQALGDDLENLQRKVRPLRRIVKSIVEENHSDSVKRYLLDTDEDVNNCLLDIDQMLALVDSLKSEVRTYKEARQSDILYVLTAVTTTFVPAQFLTGVYGMNFFDVETEHSSMPELTWKYGYPVFWCVVIIIQMVVVYIFRRMFRAASK